MVSEGAGHRPFGRGKVRVCRGGADALLAGQAFAELLVGATNVTTDGVAPATFISVEVVAFDFSGRFNDGWCRGRDRRRCNTGSGRGVRHIRGPGAHLPPGGEHEDDGKADELKARGPVGGSRAGHTTV